MKILKVTITHSSVEIELTIKETDDYFNGLKIVKLEKIE